MTTKVKVKKKKSDRKLSPEVQAKRDAHKKATLQRRSIQRDILVSLGIPKGHAGRKIVSKVVSDLLLKGDSQAQIIISLTGSDLLIQAQKDESERIAKLQQAEIERQKKIAAQVELERKRETVNRALDLLGFSTRHPLDTSVMNMVHDLVNQGVRAGEIFKRLDAHNEVIKLRRVLKEKREEFERQVDEGITERKKVRVDMREVLAYMAQKNGTTYTPPTETGRSPDEAPTRHTGIISESRLTGVESTQKDNPRQYGLPNLKATSASINKAGMNEAIKLVGGRVAEFRTYLFQHRDTGLPADELARQFMALSGMLDNTAITAPANTPDILPHPTETAPATRKWTKEEKQEARDRALAAANQAAKLRETDSPRNMPEVAHESQSPQTGNDVRQANTSSLEPTDALPVHPKREGTATNQCSYPT